MMHSHAEAEDSALYFCNCCTGIFQSQPSICGHSKQVHHINDDTEVSDADSQQTHTHNSRFSCQCCDFKTHHCDDLKKHEKQCNKNSKDQTEMGNIVPKIGAVVSTSKTMSSVNVSKDLKTYKVPSPTVSKLFCPASESDEKTSVTLAESSENCKGTLILQESTSSLNSSGVFKVTAKSIDISKPFGSHHFLLKDDLLTTDLRSAMPDDQFKDTAPGKSSGKRSGSESLENCTVKKAKSHEDKPEPIVCKLPLSSGTNFSFETSEDEEEKKVSVGDGDTNFYHCKHCDYCVDNFRQTAGHYQSDHPYIRHSAIYIQDPRDRSATFRCLECPVEFSTEDDLKRHYREDHPQAPEVFTMRSNMLVLKCFVCPLTTEDVNILKEHYKEKHPEHNLDNSLLFCRYSATSQVNTGTKECDAKSSEEILPKTTKTQHEEFRNLPSPLSPMPKGADVVLYHCNKCTFNHKSAVAVHVHYQKNHPDEAVTIDKIKQSSAVTQYTSQMTLEMLPGSLVTEAENSTPQKTSEDSSTKEDKAIPSQQKVLMSLMKLKQTLVISQTSESSKSEEVTIAVEENMKEKVKPLLKSDQPLPAGTNASVSISAAKVFYCQVCGYSNANIRSVVAHHNTKHVMYGPTGTEEVLWYNAKMQKKKLQRGTETSGTSSSKSEMRQQLMMCSEEKEAFNPYECAENLFYCQNCNFGNPTLKGVLNHQIIVHKHINTSRDLVIKYTTVIREQVQKSKSESKESSSGLPLPLMNEGDKDRLFCHFCNYRHKTMSNVMTHYFKRHPGFVVKAEQIKDYSTTLVRQMQTAQPKQDNPASHQETRNKKNVKTVGKGSSLSTVRVEEPQKSLQCYRCSYSCQQVYLLRRHMWNIHRSNRSAIDLLKMCFRKGMIESGYHCDTCMFSDTNAAVVHKHYQEQHADRKITLDTITSRLYVGPDLSPFKKAKLQTKTAAGISDGDCGPLSQRAEHNETNMFSCRACSFKGDSMLSITRHCRAVHPWFVKDDGSVPKVITSKKPAANSHNTDEHHDKTTASFDTFQVPLEFETLSDSSQEATETVKCPHCPAEFTSQRGLNTHCGLKHQDTVMRNTTRVHIFKCPYCTYVNTIYHGVLTHCQMRHPDSESRADSVHVDKVYINSWENCKGKSPGDSARFKGYMCKRCPLICATPEKLKKHMKSKQCVALTISHKAAVKLSAGRKLPPSAALRYISKASFLGKKKYSKVKCQRCDYTCSTKIALSRHLHVHHRGEQVFQCVLCYCSYNRKNQLGSHYTKSHGKDAFAKYFAPVHKQVTETALQYPDSPLTQQTQHTSKTAMTDNDKISVYKCPRCPYIHTSYHGTLTHCQMKHPTLIARADALTTDEVLLSNMVECTTGKGSMGKRGYMCRKCPQIHASLAKLKNHNEKHHSLYTATKPSAQNKTEILPQQGATKSEAASADLRYQQSRHEKEMLYRCHLCGYIGLCRKYLHSHYRNKHKLDAASTYKLLEKYNKFQFPKASCNNRALVKCKVCPSVAFGSAQLLVDHYSTFHHNDWKLDFSVVSRTSKRSTGVYRCCHCRKRINGIRKLCLHLDRHRVWKKKMAAVDMKTTPEIMSSEVHWQSDTPMFQSVKPMKSFTLQTSPRPEPEQPEPEQPEPDLPEPDLPEPEHDAQEDKRTCRQCGRSFMSLKGLRSHERSHAAVAAIRKLDHVTLSALKQNVNKYVIFKSGTLRPFLCSLCSYRTTVLGLWRSHFMKKHLDVIMDVVATDDHKEETTNQDPDISEENDDDLEAEDDSETENSKYLEPPDVQRQLDHYSTVAQIGSACKVNVIANNLLRCEFCNFSTGHMSSVRRHYLNRHGRKILRCKDCDFFTGLRKTLDVHMENGHMTRRSESSLLRCPFCLYQTNNKNHMIDHIDLHRDERVVPIEVRRPKLSRYLQGVVFRCHRCTFSSGSADSLRTHMKRHEDVRPYRCRLCYYDCAVLSHLEEHLCHKHQIVRNHELVGQVMLDQLEVGLGKSKDEEPLSNCQRPISDLDDVKVIVPLDNDDAETSAGIGKIKDINLKHECVSSPDTKEVHAGNGNVVVVQSEERDTAGVDSMFPLQTEGTAWSSDLHTRTLQLKDSNDVSLCKQDQVCDLNGEEMMDLYREMPVLENEFLKEAPLSLQQFKEDNKEEEEEGKGGGIIEDDKNHSQIQKQPDQGGISETDDSCLHTRAFTDSAVTCENRRLSVSEDTERFVCALCGRKLMSSSELKRHVKRHGI